MAGRKATEKNHFCKREDGECGNLKNQSMRYFFSACFFYHDHLSFLRVQRKCRKREEGDKQFKDQEWDCCKSKWDKSRTGIPAFHRWYSCAGGQYGESKPEGRSQVDHIRMERKTGARFFFQGEKPLRRAKVISC